MLIDFFFKFLTYDRRDDLFGYSMEETEMRFYLEFSSVTTNKYKPGLLDVGSFEITTCKCTVVDIKDSQKAYI